MLGLVEQISHSVEETMAVAAALAVRLGAGDCIALHGQLGAGKTQFVRGLVQALGGNPRAVSSPTYILLNIYETRTLTVYHLDAYRVASEEDFEGIGFEELLDQAGIVVVEWADRIPHLLPERAIHVRIEPTGQTTRNIRIE